MPKFEYLYFMVGKPAISRMIFPLIYINGMKMYCVHIRIYPVLAKYSKNLNANNK